MQAHVHEREDNEISGELRSQPKSLLAYIYVHYPLLISSRSDPTATTLAHALHRSTNVHVVGLYSGSSTLHSLVLVHPSLLTGHRDHCYLS